MKAFSMTDVGKKREVNQDYVYVSTTPVGNIPEWAVIRPEILHPDIQ